ncbi:MAG: hypothetical protein C5B49_14315 [Bdellovibrio sp.]|nr:MAG: hypothetical protein C5B49_14315 [Bdellovibrio sp.]
MSNVVCPRCGATVDNLQQLDPQTVEQISERNREQVPPQICMSCYRSLVAGESSTKSSGSALLAQERAREQRKLMLWKSRVSLIKKARACMNEKAFSEAAVSYEKYIRVLEVVFDVQAGELTPEHFKDSARTQELTVVASVFWDLLRIYDTSEKYGDRQGLAAQKLAQFLRFTPIYPDILRKAESFSRTAKNPAIIRTFIKAASENKGKCFIATSAFGSEDCIEVLVLRIWRDQTLNHSMPGRIFVRCYEWVSPSLAELLDHASVLKPLVRALLRMWIGVVIR